MTQNGDAPLWNGDSDLQEGGMLDIEKGVIRLRWAW